MRQDEERVIDFGEALLAAGASWTIVLLLSVSSLLLGVLWLVLLGEFTKPILYVTLYMLPVALAALCVGAWLSGSSVQVTGLLFAVFVASLVCIYLVRERLALTSALLTCASKALSSNYSLVAVAVILSIVQITWLGTCFLFIGLSFMSGQAVVIPHDKESGERCAWETDGWAYVGMLFIVFQMMWTNQILSDLKRFVVCAGIGAWYADTDSDRHKEGASQEELRRAWGMYGLTALGWGLSCSFGSLCLSSLVIVPCTLIRFALQPTVQHHEPWEEGCFERAGSSTAGHDGAFERAGAWWEGVCKRVWDFLQLESILGFIDRMSVPLVAITGHPFCHSAKMSTLLLGNHNLSHVVADRTNAWVLRVGSLVLACVSAAAAAALYREYVAWAVNGTGRGGSVSHLVVWVVFCGSLIASALVLQFLAGVLLDAMDGLFVLYAMDRHNKTVTGRGAEIHMMLSSMQIGRPSSGRRYTPRGWTYVGSEPTSTWNSQKFLIAQGMLPEGSEEDAESARMEPTEDGSPPRPEQGEPQGEAKVGVVTQV